MRGLHGPIGRGAADLETYEGDPKTSIHRTRLESTGVVNTCVASTFDALPAVSLTTDEKGKIALLLKYSAFSANPAYGQR